MSKIDIVVAERDAQIMRDTISRLRDMEWEDKTDLPHFDEVVERDEVRFRYKAGEEGFYDYGEELEVIVKESPCPVMIISGNLDIGDAYVKIGGLVAWSRIVGPYWHGEIILSTTIEGCDYDSEFESYLYLDLHREFQIYLSMQ